MRRLNQMILVMLVVQTACYYDPLVQNVRLTDAGTQLATANINFCSGLVTAAATQLKFIFVVDKSFANQSYDGISSIGTDPSGDSRYGTIESFLQYEQNNPNVSFSLVNFGTTASIVSSGFLNNSDFNTLIQQEWHANKGLPADSGWADYEQALGQTNKVIMDDITAARLNPNKPSSAYIVLFISGGQPFINWVADPPPSGTYTTEDDKDGKTFIRGQIVSSILAHASGDADVVDSVVLHTAFYYTPQTYDPVAFQLLELMGNWGNGITLMLGPGATIDFSQFAVPQFQLARVLKDVFVTNENAIWWHGQLMQDSDGDGLPDVIETQLGSDPHNRDSDGNGISDGVEYYAYGQPCQNQQGGKCAPALLNSACGPFVVSNSPLTLTNAAGDGFNDCEKSTVLSLSLKKFDDNLDWIPNRLAFRAGISFLSGTVDTMGDPDNDGVNNYNEVKEFTPPMFDNSLVVNLHPLQYNLTVTSSPGASPVCYNLSVNDITYFSPTDSIRVYIMENTGGKTSLRYMRTTAKPLQNNNVSFQDSDFGQPHSQ